ncbi:amino acid ABC transporter permease [Sinanaerobacter sp. ZZT-01]|uniref:amino acid ABC transporter permease n=1 Tax=Sinanaerobacter sp. ZZT-01 TaxID=3111540 RepID=UPI002D794CA9|nr:amino acid ABC transporter permease [Sinanaerobacter sp. ZZT-01]WRR94632.1 amino acid ABC transporter permease [Sinanaerobacter sp. ZZT-01]
MDWTFILKYTPLYIQAAALTLEIAFWGILFSLLLGIACSLIKYERVPILQGIVSFYIELSRNTPLLIQLFFLYFGLPKLGIRISAENCAIIGLAFLGGSYMAESFRSGLESIDKIQLESASSLGMNRVQTLQYVLFPQAMAISMPSLCANIIFLIKETSVVSAIALADLMYVTKDLIGLYYQTGEALLLLVTSYLILLLPISVLASVLERRLRYAGFGT